MTENTEPTFRLNEDALTSIRRAGATFALVILNGRRAWMLARHRQELADLDEKIAKVEGYKS